MLSKLQNMMEEYKKMKKNLIIFYQVLYQIYLHYNKVLHMKKIIKSDLLLSCSYDPLDVFEINNVHVHAMILGKLFRSWIHCFDYINNTLLGLRVSMNEFVCFLHWNEHQDKRKSSKRKTNMQEIFHIKSKNHITKLAGFSDPNS
jgi:hypothetical protein